MLFFAGQVFSLLALSTGDVSVATPVLGVKILLVALLTAVVIGDPIGARLWTAAALSSAAIAMLNVGGAHPHRRVGTTIVLAALGATAYACFDVLVQKWSPAWGTGRIVPIAMACAAAYSLPLRRFEAPRKGPGEQSSRAYTSWLAAGAAGFRGTRADVHHLDLHLQTRDHCERPLQFPRTLERGRRMGHRPLVHQSRAASRRACAHVATGRGDPVDGGVVDGVGRLACFNADLESAIDST